MIKEEKLIKHNGICYGNIPKFLERFDYEEICEKIKEEAKSNNEVSSLYLMGTEWVPGISDLDIIVVYKNSSPKQYLSNPWKLSNNAAYIFTHRYLSFNEEAFSNIYYVYPRRTLNLRLLYGKEVTLKNPEIELSLEQQKILISCNLFDLLCNKLLFLPKYKHHKIRDCRNLLGELYSIIYTLDLVNNITHHYLGKEYTERITVLKYTWFKNKLEENLTELESIYELALRLIPAIILELESFLEKHIRLSGQSVVNFTPERYSILFLSNWRSGEVLKYREVGFTIFGKKASRVTVYLPLLFGGILYTYSNSPKSNFRSNINRTMSPVKYDISSEFQAVAVKHSQVLGNMYNIFLKTGGLFKVPFSFGMESLPTRWWKRVAGSVLTSLLIFTEHIKTSSHV